MGNTLTKPAPTDAQSSVSALAQYADDQDPFKQVSSIPALASDRSAAGGGASSTLTYLYRT